MLSPTNHQHVVQLVAETQEAFIQLLQRLNIKTVLDNRKGSFVAVNGTYLVRYQIRPDVAGIVRTWLKEKGGFCVVEPSLEPSWQMMASPRVLTGDYMNIWTRADQVVEVDLANETMARKVLVTAGAPASAIEQLFTDLPAIESMPETEGAKGKEHLIRTIAYRLSVESRVTTPLKMQSVDPSIVLRKSGEGLYTLLFSFNDLIKQNTDELVRLLQEQLKAACYEGYINYEEDDGKLPPIWSLTIVKPEGFAQLLSESNIEMVFYSSTGEFTAMTPDGSCCLIVDVAAPLEKLLQGVLHKAGFIPADAVLMKKSSSRDVLYRLRWYKSGRAAIKLYNRTAAKNALAVLGAPAEDIENAFSLLPSTPEIKWHPLPFSPEQYPPDSRVDIMLSQPPLGSGPAPLVTIGRALEEGEIYMLNISFKGQLDAVIEAFKEKLNERYLCIEGRVIP